MKTVLIIDDEEDMRGILSSVLEDKYNVIEADNGLSGLAMLDEHEVDLTVTDLMMPGMDGIEFIKEIQTKGHKPIICLTGAADDYLEKIVGVYIDKLLLKPFDPKFLLECVDEILEKTQS